MKQTGDEIEWVHIPRELHEQITNELEKLKAQKELDRQEIERLKSDLLADQLAFEALHVIYPELGLNVRAEYIDSILKP